MIVLLQLLLRVLVTVLLLRAAGTVATNLLRVLVSALFLKTANGAGGTAVILKLLYWKAALLLRC